MKTQCTPLPRRRGSPGRWRLGLAAAASLLGACASTPPPTAELAVSNAAVATAGTAGGAEFAPVEMKLARDKQVRATAAMEDKDYARARSLAEEVQVDARLAEMKARSARAAKAATAVAEDGKALQEEIDRKTR